MVDDFLSARKILIRFPNWVGDIVMTLPALQALRTSMPDAHFVAMVRSEYFDFTRRIAAVDELIEAPSFSGKNRARNWWQCVKQLRRENIQGAILFSTSFESAFTVWAAGIPVRIGHSTDWRSALLTHRVSPDIVHHRSKGFCSLAETVGTVAHSEASPFLFQAAERQYVDQLFRQLGLNSEAAPIFVNPAAVKIARAWSSRRFEEMVDRIAREQGVPIFVHARHPFVPTEGWPKNPEVHLIKDVTLVQLSELIGRCRLYVGNDSGPMHIAAALGIPSIGIYGPSHPDYTSPYEVTGGSHLAISGFLECSPCRERFFEECPEPPSLDGRPPCLDRVSVETVVQHVRSVLSSS
tara:strand:+ start:45642 stop:46697 length:1056 start_codon:yes stop_codon:yes gene_type:complete